MMQIVRNDCTKRSKSKNYKPKIGVTGKSVMEEIAKQNHYCIQYTNMYRCKLLRQTPRLRALNAGYRLGERVLSENINFQERSSSAAARREL